MGTQQPTFLNHSRSQEIFLAEKEGSRKYMWELRKEKEKKVGFIYESESCAGPLARRALGHRAGNQVQISRGPDQEGLAKQFGVYPKGNSFLKED